MKRQKEISSYLWVAIYVVVCTFVNAIIIFNRADPGPWLTLMAIPLMILALFFQPQIYRISLIIYAFNLIAARLLLPDRFFTSSYLSITGGLFVILFVLEFNGNLIRRQRHLLQNLMQAEVELSQQKSFLQMILDKSPSLISVRNRNEEYVLVNATVAKLLGKPVDEIVGKPMSQLFADAEMTHRTSVENQLVFETGETQYLPERFLYDNQGNPHWYQVTKAPLTNEKGEVTSILVIADEITRQKLAADEIQKNSQFFRALAESIQYLLEGDFEVALQKTLSTLGRTTDTDCVFVAENGGQGDKKSAVFYEPRIWLKEKPPYGEDPQYPLEIPYFPNMARIYGILAAGQMIQFDEFSETEKLNFLPYSPKSSVIFPIQVDGKFWGCVGLVDWHSERKWTENESNVLHAFKSILGTAIARSNDWKNLRYQEKFTRDVLAALPVSVFVKDTEGRFVMANYATSANQKMELETVVGKTSNDIFGNERALQYLEEDQSVIRTGQVYVSPVEPYTNSEGQSRWRQVEKSPIRDATGKVTHIVGIEFDVTEQIDQNEKLRKAKEEAEAATLAKSAFLANMSHEIRTPMNAVIGMASLLIQTELTDEQLECVDTIRTSGETLLGIINKILDFSKIESEQLELEHYEFDLIESLEQTIDLFALKANEKDLELILSIAPGVPLRISGDPVRLRQVLANLIDNAIKFTEVGEIVVSVAPLLNHPQQLHFAVSDNGIGLSKEEQQRLFQSFSQVDTSITRRYGGTGLGLAISKRLCELMGGRIWLESVENQGSTFQFTITYGQIADQKVWPETTDALHTKRILLLSEHVKMRIELHSLLEQWGSSVTVVNSAAQALQALISTTYHVFIAELNMFEQSGLKAFLLEQQKLGYRETHTLLLGTTGDSIRVLDASESALNCTVFVKPIKPTDLLKRITAIVGAGRPTPPQRAKPAPVLPIDESVRILLVEDNEVNRKVALRLLQRLGYQADVAANGEEAVNLLLRQNFDIVLMDAHMPVMGGLEATRRIRAIVAQEFQPYIIGITADALASFRDECLEAGMNDYITKPVGFEDLARVLARCTEQLAQKRVVA